MSHNIHHTLCALSVTLCAFPAAAQQLDKEIVIERDIVPHLEQATRHDPAYTIIRPDMQPQTLSFSDRTVPVNTVPLHSLLEPARGARALATSPYRGYVDAAWPGVIAAGYSIINTPEMTLGVHGAYGHDPYTAQDIDMRADMGWAGADFSWSPLAGRTLTAALDWRYVNYSRHYITTSDAPAQYFNNPSLTLGWSSNTTSPLSYNVGLGASIFSYGHDYVADIIGLPADFSLASVHENVYALDAGIGYRGSDVSDFGLDIHADLIHDSRMAWLSSPGHITPNSGHTRSVAGFKPHYTYSDAARGITARIGLDLGLAGADGVDFYIAPDIQLAWNISQRLGLTLDATGGVVANTLAEVTGTNIYTASMLSYRHSHIPVDATLGVRVGPFYGASLTLTGGYARANDWLLPYNMHNDYLMLPRDVKGWHVGACLEYSYRDLIGASVAWQGASHGDNSGYYSWSDGAAGVLDASVTCTPWSPLQLQVGYGVRYGRRTLTMDGDVESVCWRSMNNAANLWAGATYRILDPLSVFGRVSNLTNYDTEILPGLPAKGLDFVVGASFKF